MRTEDSSSGAEACAECLTVGLYLGDYTHLSGLWQYWIPVLKALNVSWIPLWDRSFLDEESLRSIDALLVPGGFCWSPDTAFGGERGRRGLRRSIKRGGSYVGVCYGASVAMASGAEKRVCRLGLVPGRELSPGGFRFRGATRIDYVGSGLGYEATEQETMHVNGPMFGEGRYEVIGRFSASQPGPFETEPSRAFAGRPAAIGAEHGKGRVFAFSSHPEIPVTYLYSTVLSHVASRSIAPGAAVRRCWDPPQVSNGNMKLLRCIFRSIDRVAMEPPHAIPSQWTAERAAMLSGLKELLKLRLQEIERTLLTHLREATADSLRFAVAVVERRLRQALHILRTLDAEGLWADPAALETTSLCFQLESLHWGGDHAGILPECRFDFLVSEAKRVRAMKGKSRRGKETELAGSLLKLIVRRLDSLICIGKGCAARNPSNG